jgi:MoaA/NifB/PqqE/SkfB family radical SAM enzyme
MEPSLADPIAEAAQVAQLRASKGDVLRAVDDLQRRFFEVLRDAYGDDYYAKLVSLKVANFALAKYHFVNRHVRLASRPVTVMQDPSNACQLRCPACVHTENKSYGAGFDWPAATMKVAEFEASMRLFGPFALNVVYYNYGEPLLNKNIADFLHISNGYGMSSVFSTNLSLKFDVERFVEAGPEHVIMSIDGVTQPCYSRYRKRGNIDLVLENVRKLVAAKRRLGTNRPYLVWQFLTFQHNVHEVDDAIALARELGINEINVGTPFDVSADDSGVLVATSERQGRQVFEHWAPRSPEQIVPRLIRHEAVERAFDESWLSRARDIEEESRAESSTCPWLYWNVTIDGAKRVMPCCIAPTKHDHVVYADMSKAPSEPFDTEGFRLSRLAFADRAGYEKQSIELEQGARPFCASCTLNPSMSYDPSNAVNDITSLDYRDALGRSEAAWQALARW